MTLNDIAVLLKDNCGLFAGVFFVILSLVEISPIKINPWSWIGNVLNKGIIDRLDKQSKDIDAMKTKISNIQKEVNENSATSSRYRILRFDDELLHGVMHTKEHFDQILVDIDIYEKFCARNPDFRNNLATMAISHIKITYQKCSEDNSFL